MPQEHKTIDFQGGKIHYRDEGRNCTKTVILLHGLAQNLTVWSEITLKMLHSYRVISIDLPGHGFTSMYSEDVLTMEFISECIKEVVLNAGVRDFVIVGHSWGGYVALAYAQKYPQSVKGIGLLHSHALPDNEDTIKRREQECEEILDNCPNYILRFIPGLFGKKQSVNLSKKINTLKENCLNIKPKALVAAERGIMRRSSSVPFLSRFERPVMFVYGKDDNRIPLEWGLTMASLPQHSQLLLLDNVAHMAHLEAPNIVTCWLQSFIDFCYMDNLDQPR